MSDWRPNVPGSPFRGLLAIAMVALAGPVQADEWWPALGWACDADVGQVTIYPAGFDGNDGNLDSPVSREGLFAQTEDLSDPRVPFEVFRCVVPRRGEVNLQRVFQNFPRASGGFCGGAPWARYEVRVGGEVAVEFHNGCTSRPLVLIDINEVWACDLRIGSCRSQAGAPMRTGLTGQWMEN